MKTVELERGTHALSLALPDEWVVIDSARLAATGQIFADSGSAMGDGIAQIAGLLQDDDQPDLVAMLSLPVHDPGGAPIGLVMASLVALCLPAEECPSVDDPMFAPQLIEDVELSPGVAASFHTLTVPRWSEDESAVCLLNFSSPNLPLADLLTEGWRNIAASTRLESAHPVETD